ncbi:MAG: RagB/SusD family nutrient uptake outer membrane protein [Dysgonamonadaceae bacterium]|jgi:hypothetical protein|nr:RagB/SusD family nutrient uptake outer membrane protein [Dysgonamonadaceae bacterium]
MKKTVNKTRLKIVIAALCLLPLAGLLSCEDMLKTDNEHYLNTDGHELNSPNDTLYSMAGILRKMQAIADRYVLVGELRGDLLDITENASLDFQAIHNFDFGMTENNPYTDTRAYYDIINNCNFFIQRADTTVMAAGQQVMIKELAAVQTIRAWVYMQLILNYGKACYYEEPVLTVEDMNRIKKDPSVWISDLSVLLDRLQDQLLKAREVQLLIGNPSYTGMPYTDQVFIPATLVLGDLYLYTGNPASAAVQYHDYLYFSRRNTNGRILYWSNEGFTGISIITGSSELISLIYTTTENETGSYLRGWCYPSQWSNRLGIECSYQLKPSIASRYICETQDYAWLADNARPQDEPTYTTGDLRGIIKRVDNSGTYSTYSEMGSIPYSSTVPGDAYAYFLTSESDTVPFIIKYALPGTGNNSNGLSYIYRTGMVYLRYAEALSRMGKPTLAFAILKYGALNTVFNDPTKVNPDEVTTPLPDYCNFPEIIFPNQRSMHSRGSGDSGRNAFYVIPADVDTARFVDEKICEEMAIESAFEGNRFHDLMRFANYYGEEFLADHVARRRNTETPDPALKAKLMIRQNWYLPHN